MAKRGRKAKEKKGYFYDTEEQAIVDYINAQTVADKNKIFNTILYPALTKMIESIIRRYKLYVPDEEFEQTFNDTISYLLTKINNFDAAKGCKAYSYCGTVCKNYLYYKCSQYAKRKIRNESYDEMTEEINNIGYTPFEDSKAEVAASLIKDVSNEISRIIDNGFSLNANEIKVGKALLYLLKNWESILTEGGSNKLQKSSVLYFLREETRMSTKEVRDNMKPFKKIYKFLKNASLR